jgi:hypothetical protein
MKLSGHQSNENFTILQESAPSQTISFFMQYIESKSHNIHNKKIVHTI